MDWTLFMRIDAFELNKPSVVRGHEPYDCRNPEGVFLLLQPSLCSIIGCLCVRKALRTEAQGDFSLYYDQYHFQERARTDVPDTSAFAVLSCHTNCDREENKHQTAVKRSPETTLQMPAFVQRHCHRAVLEEMVYRPTYILNMYVGRLEELAEDAASLRAKLEPWFWPPRRPHVAEGFPEAKPTSWETRWSGFSTISLYVERWSTIKRCQGFREVVPDEGRRGEVGFLVFEDAVDHVSNPLLENFRKKCPLWGKETLRDQPGLR
ncbi:hypothetical protein E5288_WYG000004 [Bos mutus]|uniref:Uncharacterized protein n=1 Tax=Bos mutus TaxID=72004 RepID=A0A6B0RB79_9CETA|nr:hypothetical protein [Bos mutus]